MKMAMERILSDQQQRAVLYRDSACVLSSGAGCGKTTVLSARFRSLLSPGHGKDVLSIPHIAAITFTERAAREMRKRIRNDIAREVAGARDEETRKRWQTHRQLLDSATIQTIHAFCSSLLRQFPAEAGLDPQFTVLDEPAASVLKASTVRDCLQNLVTGEGELTADLHSLIVLFGWRSVVTSIEQLLMEPDETSWQTFLQRAPTEIANEWIGPARDRLLTDWLAYLRTANPAISTCLRIIEQVDPPTDQCSTTFDLIRSQYDRLGQSRNMCEDVDALCELAKVKSIGTKKHWPVEADFERVKDAFGEFRDTLKTRLAVFMDKGGEPVVRAAAVAQQFLRVAWEVNSVYRREKSKLTAVDFFDQIAMARTLLRDHKAVRDELQARFRAIMVDEFQDTDPLQLEVVQLLCGGGEWPEKLFVVGDEKQSIYRFRGADVGLFRSLRKHVPESGRLSLSLNYRSRPGILRFVNALFAKRLAGYEPLVPHRPESGRPADVEFLWTVPGEGMDTNAAHDSRSREADAIARRIHSMIRDAEIDVPVGNGVMERGVRKRDIVLLFRSMSHIAIYEHALRRYNIDYYLIGGRAFYAQQEIYDLLNLLKSLDNPLDGPALFGTLRSPFFGLSDDGITAIASHPDGLWAGLFDDRRMDTVPRQCRSHLLRARSHLTNWRAIKDSAGIHELLRRAVSESGYDAALQFEPLADRKLANLWKMLERAREYDETSVGLAGFVRQLDDLVAQQPREEQAATRPEDDDVVRLMSIHQAKGLEFPVVIVPDLASRTQQGLMDAVRWHREYGCLARRPADVDETDEEYFSELPVQLGQIADQLADWQEELRVLYVACTRAEERLILSSSWKEAFDQQSPTSIPKGGSNHWTMTLAERFDLRTGQCNEHSAGCHVEVIIDDESDINREPQARRDDSPIWLPRVPGSSSIPTAISLPALERRQSIAMPTANVVASPFLRLIPEPTVEERWFADAWFNSAVISPWYNQFRESELGQRFFAGTSQIVQGEFMYSIPPATLVGCHSGVSRNGSGLLVVGFHMNTVRDPRPGLILSAWIVSQANPDVALSAELFDVQTGRTESVEVSDESVSRARSTIRQWIVESLGIEVN
jgi:ATP-dependent helicase/nuclease subunit A